MKLQLYIFTIEMDHALIALINIYVMTHHVQHVFKNHSHPMKRFIVGVQKMKSIHEVCSKDPKNDVHLTVTYAIQSLRQNYTMFLQAIGALSAKIKQRPKWHDFYKRCILNVKHKNGLIGVDSL